MCPFGARRTVGALVGRLAEDFETWRRRDLGADEIQYLLMDGWYPKVRIGKRRVRVPVLVTLGVRADGQRVVLDLRLAGDESTAAWRDVIRGLVERQVGTPVLAWSMGAPAWRPRCVSNGRRWRFNVARHTSCETLRLRRRSVCARNSPRTIAG